MRRSFLTRLRRNGALYLSGALILLLGLPLYLLLLLNPQGYGSVVASTGGEHFGAYLLWVGSHEGLFVGYRLLQIIAFALMYNLPFTLFRIIVAQEILGREDDAEANEGEAEEVQAEGGSARPTDPMPDFAWRGKGFAVLAAWAGLFGIMLFVLGTLASTIYVANVASTFTSSASLPAAFAFLAGTFAIIANTAGGGLLALATLLFGATIARSGLKLWPGVWVAFGYMALALAAFFSGSAVGVASAPTAGQAPLTTPALLLFAAWVLWFGVLLVRLKPEP